MYFSIYRKIWLICCLLVNITAADINLSPNDTWDQTAITVAGWSNGTSGSSLTQLSAPFGISITDDDVLYISDTDNHRVVVVDLTSTKNISMIGSGKGTAPSQFNMPLDLFVTNTSLYVIDRENHRLQTMSLGGFNPATVFNTTGLTLPQYLYVDINNSIYLSDSIGHRVLLYRFNQTNETTVAGTGTSGSNDDQLNQPYGLYVDRNETLYIADCNNHRIMKWYAGASVGIRIAGDGTFGSTPTQLYYPTQVLVDTNQYMYINERDGARIVRWGDGASSGECIAACTGTVGSTSNQLRGPISLAFDRHGSLYVSDRENHRIQKFSILRGHDPSYNQPKFSPCATWNPNATTVAGIGPSGISSFSIFIDRENTLYAPDREKSSVYIWLEGSLWPTRNISAGLNFTFGVVASISGDVYIDNGKYNQRVDKWTPNATNGIVEMDGIGTCFDLFIDVYDNLYCSTEPRHQVVKKALSSSPSIWIAIAGSGSPGSASNMLDEPRGIFVTVQLNLYVADCGNDRIQLFRSGQTNGITVAGNGAPGTIMLDCPAGIILDADENLFIVEHRNDRVVASGPSGYRCIVGCSGGNGQAPNELKQPHSIRFDSYGNLFVADTVPKRIQKFSLATNSCEASYNQPKLCPSAQWNPNAITFANTSTIGINSYHIFIDRNNTAYVPATNMGEVLIWKEQDTTPTVSGIWGLNNPCSIVVTLNGELYIDNGKYNRRVDKWIPNSLNSTVVLYDNTMCYGLFIDRNNDLYCSLDDFHQVIKKSLFNNTNSSVIVAGNGIVGSTSFQLKNPRDIWVDMDLNLYVADCTNDRIQHFRANSRNGTTIVGNGANGTIDLNCPVGIVLDVDGYLFISDYHNNRIIGSGINGYRCIVGCTRVSGLESYELSHPWGLNFDSYGNLFVVDRNNSRIQKFIYIDSSCDERTTDMISTERIQATALPQSKQTSISPVNQSCLSPDIILIPSTSSLSSPMVFRRNEDFYITSSISIHCNISISLITQWTIYNCTLSNCFVPISIDPTVRREYSELYIPARTLALGIYRLELTITMSTFANATFFSSVYVEIIPSIMIVNLIQYGTSMITHGFDQDLLLDPGKYSLSSDESTFNALEWSYQYYCRIYGNSPFPHINSSELTMDDSRIDPFNPSCLSNRTDNQSALIYDNTIQSSLTVLRGSLPSNHTYQFRVRMTNRRNSSIQSTGYLLVQIVKNSPPTILIGCVISTLCMSNQQFQFINPTSQLALFSFCLGNCSTLMNIQWKIYQGSNSSFSTIQWILFHQYDTSWLFGENTNNLTVEKELFVNNRQIQYWRLEVMYSFPTTVSSSSLDIMLNKSPENGSCSIDPPNGTATTTSFTVSCPHWFDLDGIKDYSLYSYEDDSSLRKIVAFSYISQFNVRLSIGNKNRSQINLIVEIRDRLDCITEVNMSSVIIQTDLSQLINKFDNSIIQLLSSGNQNTVGQILTSISEEINEMNDEALEQAISNAVDPSTISISSLTSESSDQISIPMNESALNDYRKSQNTFANFIDYLIGFTQNLLISTSASIKLQSSLFVQLTKQTNQLTRSSIAIASDRCYQLAQSLNLMSQSIPSEDVEYAMNELIQCTSNVLTAVNGPLQGRIQILDFDDIRANRLPENYDTDLEYPWSDQRLFGDGNDNSWENIERCRNIYYQKQEAKEIFDQTKKTISLLTDAMKIHSNLGQIQSINTSSVLMSTEIITMESLSNKTLQPMRNIQIDLQSTINSSIITNQIVSLQLLVNPLASADQSGSESHTNLSRSISLSILDENGDELSLSKITNYSYRLIIPRDPNLTLPPMTLQNVTSMNSTHHLVFNLHHVDLTRTNNLSISVHVQMKPLNESLAYLFIYRFDQTPQLNTSIHLIDGWTLFCPLDLSDADVYEYFVDNEMVDDHQSLIFGLRELNLNETKSSCLNRSTNASIPITDEAFRFSSDYEIRVYTSGCYYMDENNQWKSDGLKVGSKTNVNQTECYSIKRL